MNEVRRTTMDLQRVIDAYRQRHKKEAQDG
jgi:hypothetical protein